MKKPASGLAALFPGLVKKKLKPVVHFDNGKLGSFHLEPGMRFTVAGMKMDKDGAEGYITDCTPGEETVMIMGPNGCEPWIDKDNWH